MEFLKTVFWILLGRWIYNIISLISFVIIVAQIDVAEYGIYAIASTLLIFSDVLFNDVGENSVVRSKFPVERLGFTASFVLVLFAGGIAVVSLLSAPFIGGWYDSSLLTALLQAIAAIIILQALSSVSRGILIKSGNTKQLALAVSLGNLIGAVVGIIAVYSGAGVWALLLQQAVIHSLILVLTRIFAGGGLFGRFDREVFVELLQFSWPGLWSTLLNVAANRLDLIAASVFFGPAGAGLFGLAKRLIQILQDLVGSSFDKALMSLRSRRKDSAEQKEALYEQSVVAQALLSIPTFVGFALTAALVMPLIFGAEWTNAGPLIALMAAGGVFRTMVTIERAELMSAGLMKRILVVRLAELVLTVILIGLFGDISLAVLAALFSIRYLASYILVVFSLRGKSTLMRLYRVFRVQAPMWAGAVVMCAGVLALAQVIGTLPLSLQLVLEIGVGMFLYAMTMLVLKKTWLTRLRGEI